MPIEGLPHGGEVQAAAAAYAGKLDQLIDLCITMQQIPAPTGAEAKRAAWVENRFQAMGLADVAQDELFNVYGRIPGAHAAPALLVSAHTDTVFPAATDLRLQHLRNGLISGPGIGDNSTGVAGLLILAETLAGLAAPPVDIWLVANSMEEGLGDLRGMRRAVDRLENVLGAVIVLEGMGLGRVVHQALGVRRYRISITGPGGHSWGDFGSASAIHELVAVAADIVKLQMPQTPRTTFNIGRIGGGTSVNTIAQDAWLELDLRSASVQTLAWLDEQVQRIVESVDGVSLHNEQIGNRPTGSISARHPLVQAASNILQKVGVKERSDLCISSTDANVPLSRHIPAVCLGLTKGGDAHRLSEWINPLPLVKGMQQLLYLTWWSAAWLTIGRT